MASEEQSRVYEQYEEDMEDKNQASTFKEAFPDSMKGFTLDDVPPY